mmetsp:Transcript_14647/g.40528  ORF Transcript_14647/g.40528 Transcript_14647/m.40528 type:complete len:115 (-) Transcript_14647:88-432(-)
MIGNLEEKGNLERNLGRMHSWILGQCTEAHVRNLNLNKDEAVWESAGLLWIDQEDCVWPRQAALGQLIVSTRSSKPRHSEANAEVSVRFMTAATFLNTFATTASPGQRPLPIEI